MLVSWLIVMVSEELEAVAITLPPRIETSCPSSTVSCAPESPTILNVKLPPPAEAHERIALPSVFRNCPDEPSAAGRVQTV